MILKPLSIAFLLFCIFITGCAQPGASAPVVMGKLPDSACTVHMTGSHQFCGGAVEMVTNYDCGMRGSNHCWAYVHAPDAQNVAAHSEASCIPLNTTGLECSYLVP